MHLMKIFKWLSTTALSDVFIHYWVISLHARPTNSAFLAIFMFFIAGSTSGSELYSYSSLLSTNGSDRATRYRNTNKVVTLNGKTHVAWLDWNAESMIATYDHATDTWTQPVEVGVGYDNHGGPALAADSNGYLHMIYGPHNGPFQYAITASPNDSSSWVSMPTFAQNATYPSMVIDANDTLHITYRGGDYPCKLIYQSLPSGGAWSQPRILAESTVSGYTAYHNNLTIAPNGDLHLGYDIFSVNKAQVAGHMMSTDGGNTWQTIEGTPITQPVTPSTQGVFFRISNYLGVNNIVVDSNNRPWLTMFDYITPDTTNVFLYHHNGTQWEYYCVEDQLPPELAGAKLYGYSVVGLDNNDRIYVSDVIDGAVCLLSKPQTSLQGPYELHTIAPAAAGFYPYGVNIERPTGHSDTAVPWVIYSSGHGGVDGVKSDVIAVKLTQIHVPPPPPLPPTRTTIFYDDFEEADPVGTLMPDTPPIGMDWTNYYPDSTYQWIAANPSADEVNPSDLAFYMQRGMTGGAGIMEVHISEDDQALIEANGNVTVEMKFYNIGIENSQGLYIMGCGTASGRDFQGSFEPVFWGDGSIEAQTHEGDTWPMIDTGLSYTNDAWHTVKLVADFTTDTYDLWVDGQTHANAQDLPFCELLIDATTIKRILIACAYKPSQFYFDDVLITTISAFYPGDANRDGTVDENDAAILAQNWLSGTNATWAQGDFNDDGCVDDTDAALLAANWQKGLYTTINTIPEPTVGFYLLGLLLGRAVIVSLNGMKNKSSRNRSYGYKQVHDIRVCIGTKVAMLQCERR